MTRRFRLWIGRRIVASPSGEARAHAERLVSEGVDPREIVAVARVMADEQLHIRRDERYPEYTIEDERPQDGQMVLDVGSETAARWRTTIAAYEAVQAEIEKLLASNPKYFDGKLWRY